MFERVDHLGIVLRDIDSSLPYYVDTLKLPVVGDELLPEVGVRLVYLNAGNVFLQLVQPTTSPAISRFLAEHGEGLHHVCFGVVSISETLRCPGIESQTGVFLGGRQRLCVFLSDLPNNMQIELTENQPYVKSPDGQNS